MKNAARAGGIGVEIDWGVRVRRFAGAVGKMLFRIAAARVENGQTKGRWIILRHRNGTVSDQAEAAKGDRAAALRGRREHSRIAPTLVGRDSVEPIAEKQTGGSQSLAYPRKLASP